MSKAAIITTKRTRRATSAPIPEADINAQQQAVQDVMDKARQHLQVSDQVWVDALLSAGSFHRDALQLELAVGLSLFAAKVEGSKVSLDDKRALRKIYEQAGYACSTPSSEDYKTVARRVGVAADLYTFMGGRETIQDWIEDAAPKKQVNKIMDRLKAYNFSGINSVLTYIGKPVQVKRQKDSEGPAKAPQMTPEEALVAAAANRAADARREAEAKGIQIGRAHV